MMRTFPRLISGAVTLAIAAAASVAFALPASAWSEDEHITNDCGTVTLTIDSFAYAKDDARHDMFVDAFGQRKLLKAGGEVSFTAKLEIRKVRYVLTWLVNGESVKRTRNVPAPGNCSTPKPTPSQTPTPTNKPTSTPTPTETPTVKPTPTETPTTPKPTPTGTTSSPVKVPAPKSGCNTVIIPMTTSLTYFDDTHGRELGSGAHKVPGEHVTITAYDDDSKLVGEWLFDLAGDDCVPTPEPTTTKSTKTNPVATHTATTKPRFIEPRAVKTGTESIDWRTIVVFLMGIMSLIAASWLYARGRSNSN